MFGQNEKFSFGEEKMIGKEVQISKGDSKPELHYFGQITGGVDFETEDGLFCEMLPDAGENWDLLEPNQAKTYITQTTYSEVFIHSILKLINYQKPGQMFIWAHPIDLHFAVNDLHGWPRAIFKIWRLDTSNKIDIFSYGTCALPKNAGYHKIYVDTWSPMGDWKFGTLSFFLGNQPQIANKSSGKHTIPYDIVNNSENRSKLLGRSNGKIYLEIECMTKNIDRLNMSGSEPKKLKDQEIVDYK